MKFFTDNNRNESTLQRNSAPFLTGQDKIIKSGYTIFQIKKGLSKAWVGYTIAKTRGENASIIQKLQRELLNAGITSQQYLAKFPSIDIDIEK